MYGTASEHSVLYQYQLYGAKNVFMGNVSFPFPNPHLLNLCIGIWNLTNRVLGPNGESLFSTQAPGPRPFHSHCGQEVPW